jgi:hypothetical protein
VPSGFTARWPVADLLGHVEVYIITLATSIECIRAGVGGDGRVACRGAVGHLGIGAAPRTPRPKGLDSELGQELPPALSSTPEIGVSFSESNQWYEGGTREH